MKLSRFLKKLNFNSIINTLKCFMKRSQYASSLSYKSIFC
ncbi:MAG: hypothetical protein OFPII_38260 [Osedax symbiont Rs1]|nr:MAG: hypothetical protein OFPII_38260 [Osedax symbiont Rs1]